MKIALGSTSEDKLNYLKEVLDFDTAVDQFPADSEISDQPLSLEETLLGSKNRAKNCYRGEYDYSVGMEGGLVDIDGLYHLVCAVSFYDGKNYFSGVSEFYPLPKAVSDGIKNGGEFGVLIREFAANHPKTDASHLISRQPAFAEAIKKALQSFTKQ